MSQKVFVCVFCILMALSCSKKEPAGAGQTKSGAEAGAAAETAPKRYETESRSGGYTGVMITARRRARETAALLGIRQAIEAFKVTNGKLPASLDELKNDGYAIPEAPEGLEYGYEPETGEIHLYYKQQGQPRQ